MRALARFALRLKDRRVQQMLCSSSVWDYSAKELAKSRKLTRYFSSGSEPPAPDFSSGSEPPAPDFLCSKRVKDFICRLEVNTDDFSDGQGCSQQLKSVIDASLEETKKKYKIEDLKSLYYRLVRPELISRLLIHNRKFDDTSTHWLAYQTHGHTKNKPRFISSYDLMVHLVGLLEAHWVFFLDYLSDERIAVVEDWIQISTVQHLMYDHGLKDFSIGSGIHFYKGECDASYFHPHGEPGTSAKVLHNSQVKRNSEGKADLATLIWDDDQVISSLTYRGVESSSTQEAEAKAAFALLNRAKELKIEHFVLWTDSRTVWGVLSGTRPIEKGEANEDLFMALKFMRTSFKILVPMHMPREVMAFSDGMLRKTVLKYPRFPKKSAQQWAYYLNGLPIFKLALTQDARKTLNAGKQKPTHGELRARVYYVEVAPDRKISSLLNLTRALNASRVYLVVHDYESKPDETRKDLEEIMGNSLLTHHGTWSILCTFSQRSEKKGGVVIVYDGICPNNLLNHQVDMVIILSSENDREALSRIQAKELSASSWIHFKGVLPPGRPAP